MVEEKSQSLDATSVSVVKGRLLFHGLRAEEEADIRRWLRAYIHFNGEMREDRLEDAVGFSPQPLDWHRDCAGGLQPNFAFFSTPWQSTYYHDITDQVGMQYPMLRSANALPAALLASFPPSRLQNDHPRSIFPHWPPPDPPIARSDSHADYLSPFSVPHLSNASHSTLYLFHRWIRIKDSPGSRLWFDLFAGDQRSFAELEKDARTCFRRIRWGRGALSQYFAHPFPFPLWPSAALFTAPEAVDHPSKAAAMAAADLELYTRIELGKWAGIYIDFQNWVFHSFGQPRRVRPGRAFDTHEPLPGVEVKAEPQPSIVHITRSRDRGRFVSNPDCLSDAAAALQPPLTVVHCCDWSRPLPELARVFQAADIMLGLHGAGLTNIFLMPPGGVLLELGSFYSFDNNFFGPLSDHLDHLFLRTDARPFSRQGADGYTLSKDFCAATISTALQAWHRIHQPDVRMRNVNRTDALMPDRTQQTAAAKTAA